MKKDVRICGFGGQGVILAGFIIGKAASVFQDFHAVQSQSYGPEARGGAARYLQRGHQVSLRRGGSRVCILSGRIRLLARSRHADGQRRRDARDGRFLDHRDRQL